MHSDNSAVSCVCVCKKINKMKTLDRRRKRGNAAKLSDFKAFKKRKRKEKRLSAVLPLGSRDVNRWVWSVTPSYRGAHIRTHAYRHG